MKQLLIIIFLAMSVGAMSQRTFTTDCAYKAIKDSGLRFTAHVPQQTVIRLSAGNDSVWVGSKVFVYVNDTLGYRDLTPTIGNVGKGYAGIFYFSGLGGAFLISVEYDDVVYFYHTGELSKLDGAWVWAKEF